MTSDIVSEVHQSNTTSSSDIQSIPSFGYLVHFSDADEGVSEWGPYGRRPTACGLQAGAPY